MAHGGIESTLSHSRRRRTNLYLKHFSCHDPSSQKGLQRFVQSRTPSLALSLHRLDADGKLFEHDFAFPLLLSSASLEL